VRREWAVPVKGDGGQGRNRTIDTRIFSPLLYQLSYLASDVVVVAGRRSRATMDSEGRVLKRGTQGASRKTESPASEEGQVADVQCVLDGWRQMGLASLQALCNFF
jgi:hypothetical protein